MPLQWWGVRTQLWLLTGSVDGLLNSVGILVAVKVRMHCRSTRTLYNYV